MTTTNKKQKNNHIYINPLTQTHIFCKKGQGRPKRCLAGGTHNVRRPRLWLGVFRLQAKLEPSSPQWLPELAGGQLQTELCELVEVGGSGGGRMGRKEGRTKEAREIGWSFQCLLEIWAPQTWDGEQVVFICFFWKGRLSGFWLLGWGRYREEKKGEELWVSCWEMLTSKMGWGLGGLCLSFLLFLFWRSIELDFARSLSFFGYFIDWIYPCTTQAMVNCWIEGWWE